MSKRPKKISASGDTDLAQAGDGHMHGLSKDSMRRSLWLYIWARQRTSPSVVNLSSFCRCSMAYVYIYTYDYMQSTVVLSAYVLTRRTGMYGACCKCRKYWPGRMFRDFSALRIGVSEPCFRGPAPVPESVILGLKLAF